LPTQGALATERAGSLRAGAQRGTSLGRTATQILSDSTYVESHFSVLRLASLKSL